MKQKYYLVRYSGGDYEDWYDHPVFTTNNEKTAKTRVENFNNKLPKLKKYCSELTKIFDDTNNPLYHNVSLYRKVYDILEIHKAYYKEIEFRP